MILYMPQGSGAVAISTPLPPRALSLLPIAPPDRFKGLWLCEHNYRIILCELLFLPLLSTPFGWSYRACTPARRLTLCIPMLTYIEYIHTS